MSEDRFKQARKSLIDRQNPQKQGEESFGDFEDEATAMVDLNAMSGGRPQFGPPPTMAGSSTPGQQIPPPGGAAERFPLEQYGNPAQAPATGSVQMPNSNQGNAPMVVGEDVGYEGSTQFINIAELAAEHAEDTPPDEHAVGYEGSTQFIDLNALQGQAPQQTSMNPEDDAMLCQGYTFGPESVQRGQTTLVFAQNPMGKSVVLKRVWEGEVRNMPDELRMRVAGLDPIRHEHLIGMNGMVATASGAYLEFDRPTGRRLTDLISQGPVAAENAIAWIAQAAEVITSIHQYQFVYANLTTDAIWVQDDGSILLEPFDILTFEDRGNLGPFGAPELSVPPEQRIVSPATDVFSMAAVLVAALTGLPVNLQNVHQLDPKVGEPCIKAFSPDPNLRPFTPADFVAELQGGKKKKSGGGDKPNVKIIAAVAAVMVLILAGAFVFKQQQDAAAAAERAERVRLAEEQELANAEDDDTGDSETNDDNGDDGEKGEAVEGPGPIESDSRLTVEVSFKSNPPKNVVVSTELAPEELDGLRKEIRALLKDMKRLTNSAQNDRYRIALTKMAQIGRAQGKLEPQDQELLADLFSRKLVRDMRKENLDQIDEALRADKLTSAKLFYQQLEVIDSGAESKSFFNRNKSAKIKKLERAGAKPEPK